MKYSLRRILCFVAIFLLTTNSYSQEDTAKFTQKVHGYITDAESKQPLQGVIILLSSNKQINAFSDSNGYYVLDNVPIGRQSFEFNYVGYEPRTVQEVMVTTGKELELNISMTENLHQLSEVKITATKNRTQALNEFATLSARSFSVEETRRYAASISDPARMVTNFAGVSGNGDLENDIVVRGNTPKGVLWRLEGIEIPNPNHFSYFGNSGGGVSMLNANTLATSDFYTGAFPPEIGNALSGAFDLYFRNGNKDEYEHTVQVGLLGTEIATEGPFKKGGQSSYLIDYRYSTLALLLDYLNLNGLIPDYQDLSFKLNFPSKKIGTISVFGIGGANKFYTDPKKDSTEWDDTNPNVKLLNKSKMGTAGISHQYFITPSSYLKTIISGSYELSKGSSDTLNAMDAYNTVPIGSSSFTNTGLRISVLYNNKLSNRNTIRTGIIAQQLGYKLEDNYYDFGQKKWVEILNTDGSTQFYQAYLQWKSRLSNRFSLVTGVHGSYYALNGKSSIEPRGSLSYSFGINKLTLAAGLHSKPDHISTYLYRDPYYSPTDLTPNKNLDLLRAFHLVLGYEVPLPLKSRMKIELYYQRLYNIPVEKDSASGFSMLNAESVYSLIGTKPLVSTGTGQNYGIDLTLEKPLSDNYYILLTTSLYRSTYTNYKGDTYEGHFDRSYQVNLIGGKEFYLNKKGRSILGANGKILYSGGQRESPIDLPMSIASGKAVYVSGQYYTLQDPYYFRMDASLYLKLNNKKATHSIEFDIQNVTNRRNFSFTYFDNRSNKIKNVLETGLIPALSYRIEFHR
jgi:hypothetical protein